MIWRKASGAPVSAKASGGAEEKAKALETALAQIKKQFGEGAVMRLGQDSALNVEAIPTGSLSLDLALGIGGLPRGRIIEIYGPESSGKTTLALHCIAEGQKRGGNAAFIDVEHALDPVYAGNLGVDVDSLLVSQPDTGEQALEITEALVRSNAIDVIVVDSVAALVPRAEIEGEMGDSHVGLQARLMSQALRKLAGAISKSNCVAIFINQLREKVGVIYGNPEVTPGGRALKFYSSVRIEVRKARGHQERYRRDWQPHPGQGGEKQNRPALPHGGVRHHVRHGHFPHGRAAGHCRKAGDCPESRGLVLLQRGAHRPGPGQLQGIFVHPSRNRPGGGGQGSGERGQAV